MTRLRKAILTFVSEERKLHHNYSMSPIPQKLIASYSIRGLAVPRAGDRSFVTGSIHGESRSHLIYAMAHPGFGKGRHNRRRLREHSRQHDESTAANNFFCGFHIKNTYFSTHFIAKGQAVSAISTVPIKCLKAEAWLK